MKIDLSTVRLASTISCPIQFGALFVKKFLPNENERETCSPIIIDCAAEQPEIKPAPFGLDSHCGRWAFIFHPIDLREGEVDSSAGEKIRNYQGQGFFQSLVARRPINQGKGPLARRLIFGRRHLGGGLFSEHVAPALHAGHAANFAKPSVF
jgi:hypothetical protein